MATVSDGREEVAKLIIAGESGNEFDSIAIGSDGSSTTDDMTEIQNEEDSEEDLSGSVTGNTAEIDASFTNVSADIEEVSIYESTNDVMLARQTIDTVPLQSSDTLDVTWQIDIEDA